MARITNDVTRRTIRQVDIGHVRAMQGYPDRPGGASSVLIEPEIIEVAGGTRERVALHHSVKTIV
jgi:hypothetical protein